MADNNIFNVSDYENITKPKPPKILTKQEIFEGVVVGLFKYKSPSIYVVEIPRPGSDEKLGDWEVVNFNVYGARSPLLAFTSQEEFRVLLASVGWSELRDIDNKLPLEFLKGAIPETAENYSSSKKLAEHLKFKGLTFEGLVFLKSICDNFHFWATDVGREWECKLRSEYIHPHFAMKNGLFRAWVTWKFSESFKKLGSYHGLNISSAKLTP